MELAQEAPRSQERPVSAVLPSTRGPEDTQLKLLRSMPSVPIGQPRALSRTSIVSQQNKPESSRVTEQPSLARTPILTELLNASTTLEPTKTSLGAKSAGSEVGPEQPESTQITKQLTPQTAAKPPVRLEQPSASKVSAPTEQPGATERPKAQEQRRTIGRLLAKIRRPGTRTAWQNPELSIGTKCNRTGGLECWEAVGPAKELFQQLQENIGNFLSARSEEIDEGEPVAGYLIFRMYMIGKTSSTAKPTLVFTSQRKPPRLRAIRFVKESDILEHHPEIALAHSSQSPMAGDPVRLYSGRGQVFAPIDLELDVTPSDPNYYEESMGPLLRTTFGIPIVCPSTGRNGTIGGIIQSNGRHFGLTVAHIFTGSRNGNGANDTTIDDFAFDREEDVGPINAEVTLTSTGSVSSGGSLSRSGTTATATTGNGINESSSTLQDVVLYNGQENQKILKMKLGELAFSSLDVARQFGLDWALIELSDRVIARLLEHETFPNFALPRRYVDVVNKDEEVIVVNGYSGVLRGTLSSSPTMIRLPQSNNFQEVWAIRIITGDCGAWVLNSETGDLHGHVVAGHPDGRVVYIIPAYKIFNEVKKHLADVKFELFDQRAVGSTTKSGKSLLKRKIDSSVTNTSEKPPPLTKTTPLWKANPEGGPMSKTYNIDILAKGSKGSWTKEQLSLRDFLDLQYDSQDAFIAFFPDTQTLVDLQVDQTLASLLQIPRSFFKSISIEASGFFGSRGISSNTKTSSLFYRFLIKETINRSATFPKFQNYGIQYIWHKICFFTSWTPSGKIRILCFDLPASLQESIIYSARENSELGEGNGAIGALAMNNILVEETVGLFEKSVWSWRHVIRDLEMNRPLTNDSPPNPDYIKMHEIARHIIHSSETITVALETLSSMLKCYSNSNIISPSTETEVVAELQQQISLLKCLQLRSQAVEARLKNEINLAFNLVALYDSHSAVQISTNTATYSGAMKTISVLGLVFLPGIFFCSLFSTTFFSFTPALQSPDNKQHWTISSKFYIYPAVTIPVTLLTIAWWLIWMRTLSRRIKPFAPPVRAGTFNSKTMKV